LSSVRIGRSGDLDASWRDKAVLYVDLEERHVEKRFLLLSDVADVLNISAAQAYALVRSGELPAIKVGGRGQWRVESAQLERYIKDAYDRTREFVDAHPFGGGEPDEA
jgi:excisionase family DNA binding protein